MNDTESDARCFKTALEPLIEKSIVEEDDFFINVGLCFFGVITVYGVYHCVTSLIK
jgi:hypothetical protein